MITDARNAVPSTISCTKGRNSSKMYNALIAVRIGTQNSFQFPASLQKKPLPFLVIREVVEWNNRAAVIGVY